MSSRTTPSIQISDDIAEKLDRLAHHTGRSKASLAADALADYLDREIEIGAGGANSGLLRCARNDGGRGGIFS